MTKILFLITGGALGTLARYGLSGLMHKIFSTTFPLGTLIVNLTGSLLIGIVWGLWENNNITSNMRTFIFIGIFGGFTTFSSYALESLNLFRDGDYKMAILNITASNLLGIILVFAGFCAAKAIVNLSK